MNIVLRSIILVSLLGLHGCTTVHVATSSRPPEKTKSRPSDRSITAAIRQSIVGDETMSVNAQNIVIQTANGHVHLFGAVDNETEAAAVMQKAEHIAGVSSVDNHMLPLTRGLSGIPTKMAEPNNR